MFPCYTKVENLFSCVPCSSKLPLFPVPYKSIPPSHEINAPTLSEKNTSLYIFSESVVAKDHKSDRPSGRGDGSDKLKIKFCLYIFNMSLFC